MCPPRLAYTEPEYRVSLDDRSSGSLLHHCKVSHMLYESNLPRQYSLPPLRTQFCHRYTSSPVSVVMCHSICTSSRLFYRTNFDSMVRCESRIYDRRPGRANPLICNLGSGGITSRPEHLSPLLFYIELCESFA